MSGFDEVPLNAHVGMRLVRAERGASVLELPPQPWFRQEGGVIHGGMLTTLADTAAVYAIEPTPIAGSMVTIELSVNFLSAARADRGVLVAEARVVRRGGRVAVVAVDVRQDANHVLTGLFTFLLQLS